MADSAEDRQTSMPASSLLQRVRAAMFQPVDPASLVFFRIAFGVIMLIECWRYFSKGWIARYYIDPSFQFKYSGFSWVEPWNGSGMYWHFALLALLAACIMVGAFYRVATVLFFFAFTYVFLLEQAHYLNHFYLVILISFLLCFLPAHRAFSVDGWRSAKIRSATIPAWAIWVLVIQFEIMLIYAGLVKINPDWLRLEPLGSWLNQRDELPIIGKLFAQPWFVALGAYGVIALHILGAPLLLWKKTRRFVFIVYLLFHLSNHVVFTIGIFPWFTIVATLMFFDPDWPRQVARKLIGLLAKLAGVIVSPTLPSSDAAPTLPHSKQQFHWVLALFVVWFAGQILFPLRHFVYPGQVAWSEDGHRFAWRMKLRDKEARVRFSAQDIDSAKPLRVDISRYLNRRQIRKMSTRPDMILQFAQHLESELKREHGLDDIAIYGDVRVSLNGRPYAQFFDRRLDLSLVDPNAFHSSWITPLKIPLPAERAWAK